MGKAFTPSPVQVAVAVKQSASSNATLPTAG